MKRYTNYLMSITYRQCSSQKRISHKIFGVYLDENPSWKYHVDIISTKICSSTGILYRTRYIPDKFLRK